MRILRAGQFRAALIGLVVALLVVAAVLLGLQWRVDRQTEQARGAAVDAARKQAVAMLAYDFAGAATELPKAVDGLTGDFAGEYRKLIDTVIIPGAQEGKLTVKVDVRAASVVSAGPKEVTVLLFLNQVTTDKTDPKAVVTGSRIRMQLNKVDDRWLTASLTPL